MRPTAKIDAEVMHQPIDHRSRERLVVGEITVDREGQVYW